MKRIVDLPLADKIKPSDYTLIESPEDGQRKTPASIFEQGGIITEELDATYTVSGVTEIGMEVILT